MVLVFCTWYHGDKHLHSFKKILKQFLSILHEYITEIIIFKVQRAITPKVGKPVMIVKFCTLSHDTLHLCEVLSKYLEWFSTYRADMKTW